MKKKLTKEEWFELLSEGEWNVHFRSAMWAGVDKTMTVTLDPALIPRSEHPRIKKASWWSSGVTCWSTDREGWRTFMPRNVIEYDRID